ncbi:MAG: hypothetical protein V4689_12090 [Verrucomicrobiota bacterium]
MAATDSSKYAENQFLTVTAGRFPLMGEILADTLPRATAAIAGNPDFLTALGRLQTAAAAWDSGETTIANAEAALPAATLAFEDKLASLTRKPDADSNSLLETWDNILRSQVAYRGPLYQTLLPGGRSSFTRLTLEARLDALRDFGIRLSGQNGKPALVALGTTVATFSDAARVLRTAQTHAKSTLETARLAQETLRVHAARALYGLIGQGMSVWNDDPARVDTLWNVHLLRSTPRRIPAPPADTTWDPATRTLSTTVLPSRATRLEAWRSSPGSLPELLLTAAPGTTAVALPATVTFIPGTLYQLWLVAINSKGRSEEGPVRSWVAE